MSDTQWIHRKHSFDPVVDSRTRLLILGSLPGDISLRAAQYYGNPQNAFWRLMSKVVLTDLEALDYEARLTELLRHRVGLWDVIAHAARAGSLDSSISSPQPNDLIAFLSRNRSVEALAFNGKTAAKIGLGQLANLRSRLQLIELPSSSPAHAIGFAAKFERWIELRQFCG
jgi:hypoxanthine-DNA glycosylase